MDDSGAILCQISSFKDMLDQVNEEIEEKIQKTREIESEIVKCSEIEKGYLTRESELTKMVSVRDFELNGLMQVSATAKKSVDVMEKELKLLKINLDETMKRVSEKRGENEELRILLLEKEALENEKNIVNMKVKALQNSTKELIAEILEEIHTSNAVLEVEVQHGTSENRELLRDIDDLKLLIRSI